MVAAEEKKKALFGGDVESMAMGSERSKLPLHNFTLPSGLRWGNHKFLRCYNLDSTDERATARRRSNGSAAAAAAEDLIAQRSSGDAFGLRRRGSGESPPPPGRFKADVEEGIAAVRKKLIYDLQAATDKMKDEILRSGLRDEAVDEEEEKRRRRRSLPSAAAEDGEERSLSPATTTLQKTSPVVGMSKNTAGAAEPARPWNLRTRRASSGCKQPTGFATGSTESNPVLKIDVSSTPNASSGGENKSSRLRSSSAAAACGGEKRERAKFSVSLSRQEIEEDFAAIVHHRPPRRPKKRPKIFQKNLDTLFPGLWLTEITPDLYNVSEDH